MVAKSPGSIHAPYSLVGTPKMETRIKPIILPYKAPVYLYARRKTALLLPMVAFSQNPSITLLIPDYFCQLL